MYYIVTIVQEILLCKLYCSILHLNCMHVSELYACFQTFSQALTNKGYRGFESPFFWQELFCFVFAGFLGKLNIAKAFRCRSATG